MTATVNFTKNGSGECQQNATFYKVITLTDDDNNAIDLTSCTAKMQIRKDKCKTVDMELSTSNGRITLTGTAGIMSLYITDEDTLTMKSGRHLYDLYIVNIAGDSIRLMEGEFYVSPTITK